jgi:hypothetical protein
LAVLARELGPVDLVRFLQQFEAGEGDYSRDRGNWLPDQDAKALAATIRRDRPPIKD